MAYFIIILLEVAIIFLLSSEKMYFINEIDEVPNAHFYSPVSALLLLCLAESSPVAGSIQKGTKAHAGMMESEVNLASLARPRRAPFGSAVHGVF